MNTIDMKMDIARARDKLGARRSAAGIERSEEAAMSWPGPHAVSQEKTLTKSRRQIVHGSSIPDVRHFTCSC